MIWHWLAVVVFAAVAFAAAVPLAAAVPHAAVPLAAVPLAAVPLADPAAAPAEWNNADAHALSSVIGGIARDGLDPADHDPEALVAALARGDSTAIAVAASRSFLRLAADLAQGNVSGSSRIGWFIAGSV